MSETGRVSSAREAAHTRTSTDCGPDFCDECSRVVEDWVKWPCPSGLDAGLLFPPEPNYCVESSSRGRDL